ncbi:MAG: shikimate kinase [Flavobacteriaceae bacterium]
MSEKSHNAVSFKGLIVLLGYMGCGKSTVGRLLADQLKIPFIDLDQYIEKDLGVSVPEIFAQRGALFFRQEEHKHLNLILDSDASMVLSLGGGAPCYHNNMALINRTTKNTFYLAPTVPELANRLFPKRPKRPLIAHIQSMDEMSEFIAKHIFERSPFYEKAQHTLRVDAEKPEDVVELILEKLS